MKYSFTKYLPLFVLIIFQHCISLEDTQQIIDDKNDKEEEVEKEEENLLEDLTDLPFAVNWSINKEGDEIDNSFDSYLHVKEKGNFAF